jgi:hypothetical protein
LKANAAIAQHITKITIPNIHNNTLTKVGIHELAGLSSCGILKVVGSNLISGLSFVY